MDRPTNLMVVTCVFWFDRPLDWNRVAAAFAERLVPAFPRFAQRVVEPPVTLGLVGPRWADVERFDVRDHLRRVVLPAPGGDAELHAHVSAQADRPLDPDRPLWEAHLVDGFGDGWAILLRTHHAIADGTALVQALLALADPPPDGGTRHAGQRLLAERPFFGVPIRGPSRPSADDGRPALTARARAAVDRAAMLRRLGFAPGDEPSVLRGPLSGRKRMTWSPAVPLELSWAALFAAHGSRFECRARVPTSAPRSRRRCVTTPACGPAGPPGVSRSCWPASRWSGTSRPPSPAPLTPPEEAPACCRARPRPLHPATAAAPALRFPDVRGVDARQPRAAGPRHR
jgi:wax ester synthase-like acyl-CoA acyltransferase family protein